MSMADRDSADSGEQQGILTAEEWRHRPVPERPDDVPEDAIWDGDCHWIWRSS